MSTTTSPSSGSMFMGTSQYSSDFDQLIQRDVEIASLPIAQMQSDVTDLTNQSSELNTLSGLFTSLQTSISDLNNAVESGSLSATVSDTSVLSATVSAGAIDGATYTVEVANPGSYTEALSNAQGVAPAIVTKPATQTISSRTSPSYTLTVDSASGPATYAITPASENLNALAAAINQTSAAGVTASVVNVGTSASPDYRLSLVSTNPAATSVQLSDGSIDLETAKPQTYAAAESPAPGTQLVTDPTSQTISDQTNPAYTLTIGSASGPTTFSISPAGNDLNSLADAINQTEGANLTATAVNVGSDSTPDYRLSLVSSDPDATSLQLNDGSTNLLSEEAGQSFATAQSSAPGLELVTDPTSQTISAQANPAYTLTVGSASGPATYTIAPASNDLNALAAAINATSAAGVIATVVNAGTSASPDYRLSLVSTQSSTTSLQLGDGSMNLEAEQTAQSLATAVSSAPQAPVVTDPSSQSISAQASPGYSLTVGPAGNTETFQITPASHTLTDLASAINSMSAANVQASIVNVGSDASPDYRLELQSATLGPNEIQLSDGTSNLVTQQGSIGALASYSVDGQAQQQSDSSTITVAPGVTVQLLAASPSGQPSTITIAGQSSSIYDALNEFVSAYNSALTELNNQRGQSGGALTGQSITYQLADALENLNGYFSGGTGVSSLAALGISMDDTGQMSFDQSTFDATAASSFQGMTSFLGGATTGGFLEAAANTLDTILDPISGELTTDVNSTSGEITNLNSQITTEQQQVNTLQTNLTNEMTAADASIATMEQQYSVVSGLLQAMQTNEQEMAAG